MNKDFRWEKNGFVLRTAKAEDTENYFLQNYCPLEKETARLTGCKEEFTKDEVLSFFQRSVEDEERYFFLITEPGGRIIGESVINEIDFAIKSANFRIAIFHSADRGNGVGTWATETTRDFAFEELGLHRLEPDVFSFNPGAEKVYLKAGFKKEGVLRDTVLEGGRYADDILMAILRDEWKAIKGK